MLSAQMGSLTKCHNNYRIMYFIVIQMLFHNILWNLSKTFYYMNALYRKLNFFPFFLLSENNPCQCTVDCQHFQTVDSVWTVDCLVEFHWLSQSHDHLLSVNGKSNVLLHIDRNKCMDWLSGFKTSVFTYWVLL